MEKFSLELENWGNWELERDFSSLDRARRYGLERFAQNEWRIFDRIAGAVVYTHDPTLALQESAREELSRFAETERWRQRFAERAAAEVVARQQRERMVEVATRQRQRQRQRDQENARRERLRGFRFVGQEPRILRQPSIADFFDLDLEESIKVRDKDEMVNWLKEGF